MNKQWLKARIEAYLEYTKTLTASDYARGKQSGYRTALRLIKKLDEPQVTAEQAWNKIAEAYPESVQSLRNTLDNAVFGKSSEPQKPVVPRSVGALIEFYREEDVALIHILKCFKEWADTDNEHTDEVNWIISNPEIFMRAWLDGYDVEKEPLYVVSLPGYNESMLAYDSVVEDYVIVDENFNDELGVLRFELTEKEIKSKDERYWPFAEPVEEVAEG